MSIDRIAKAKEAKGKGNNCAQAVLLAFEDKIDVDNDKLIMIGSCLGLGNGEMKGNCGALVGAEVALGLLTYEGKNNYVKSKELYNKFHQMVGSSICEEIKGIHTKKILCSCEDCVVNAVKCLEELI